MYKSIHEIRQEFLNFFTKKEHHIVSSSSLVPENDKTLLFTNSGMIQFKGVFIGIEDPLFKRVVTVQRCMRAGGKHNDLNNVGYTERHLTFFEMLGNFSFGDYFKYDAIQFAWELLTDKNWFNLSKDKIWVTTHINDNESYDIWKNHIGISSKHIVKIGNNNHNFCDSENFWQMGNIGPCGPCSEIFYDRGDEFQGVPPGYVGNTGERYIEIWNLVFIQFERKMNGNLIELPMLSVDTGMGLERITSVLQNVSSNYLIDVFKKLISAISKIIQVNSIASTYYRSLYVIADHIRACAFLIRDGVFPSNEGRGYVLRKIIRRAICHGKKIGKNDIFLYRLVKPLIKYMPHISDLLIDQKELIENTLFNEEKLFKNTLQRGLELLEAELIKLKNHSTLKGDVIFRLYTTYGFPVELTRDVCHARNIKIDLISFNQMMLKEKKSSKKLNQCFSISNDVFRSDDSSAFIGYDHFVSQSQIIKLIRNSELVNIIDCNQNGIVILNTTPFYGESGGQIGDIGYLQSENAFFQVTNTLRYGKFIVHEGLVSKGNIKLGDKIFARIDQLRREKICLNHSATHLLHASLIKILGSHVIQKGSLVNDEYLRFDFSHDKSLTTLQINIIENLVNQQIWNNLSIVASNMSIENAQKIKAIMLLDKKYDTMVRVLRIGDFSVELCGGTHARYTGEIGLFIITKEIGIGSGIRRIEAVTQNVALSLIQDKRFLAQSIIQEFHSDENTVLSEIKKFKKFSDKLKKEIRYFKNKQELQSSLNFLKDVSYIKNVSVLLKKLNNFNIQLLSSIIRNLQLHLKSGIIVFLNLKNKTEYHIVINVTCDIITNRNISALDLVNDMIRNFGGKGGGKPDFAQAKINTVLGQSEFMNRVYILLKNSL